jgi:paraquat-inducible protein B
MTKKANPKVIGAFMVGAVVLAAIGVIIFGSGRFFAKKYIWVLYFPGSVKGLTVGAPVTLKGVEIGTVVDVKAVFDRQTMSFQSPVYVEILPDRVKSKGEYIGEARTEPTDPEEVLKWLVEHGLRGKLELQSLVTGKLQVELDMYPGTKIRYVNLDKKTPELPTLPTELSRLIQMLQNLDLEAITKDVRETLAGIRKLATSPELQETITSLNKTLQDFGKLARNTNRKIGPLADSATTLIRKVDGQVDPLLADLNQTLDKVRVVIEETEATLVSVRGVVGEDSPFMWELESTLKELRAMASSIDALVNDLQIQPDSLIRGKSRLGGK